MIDLSSYRITDGTTFKLSDAATHEEPFYSKKKKFKKQKKEFRKELDELQSMMYAHDRYGLLVIFQAMDAAGKDSTIKHVMSGVNPHGVVVHAFKKPSDNELDHDFMWRTNVELPRRGKLGIFNRSYYEEVLVVKVHTDILTKYQRLPAEHTANPEYVWPQRYAAIRNMESYLYHEGIRVVKFFLNISKDEQARRFLDRLETPSKNWKFAEADLKERGYWDDYMAAYEKAIQETAADYAPWYVIPADDKDNMRLIVSKAILHEMKKMDMSYPEIDDARMLELSKYKDQLKGEIG